MRSLKLKFTVVISTVIIAVVGVSAYTSFLEDRRSITQDIFRNGYTFSDLVSQRILGHYQGNYLTGNFVKFKTLIQEELEKTEVISDLYIVDYEGTVGYHYKEEKDQQYVGEARSLASLQGRTFSERIQAVYPSLEVASDGRILYFDREPNSGRMVFVDHTGKAVDAAQFLKPQEEVRTIVRPLRGNTDDQRHALVYVLSYDLLSDRLFDKALQAGMLTLIFILGGVFIAYLFAGRVVRPIKKLTEGALRIADGEFGDQIAVKSNDEVGLLTDSFNQMSLDLKNATDELVARERLQKEVELASKIQQEFLPKSIPLVGNLDIVAGVRPADAVGGDCYDFIPLSDDRLLFFIGDVTGHGVSAGLLTAIANSILFAFSSGTDVSPRTLSVILNRVLHAKTRPDMFITMFVGLWDGKTGKLLYTPSGHEPTYHYKARTKELTLLKKEGMALGMLPNIEMLVREEEIIVEEGDVLILYSDGIPEAWSKDRVIYGKERFEASILRHIEKSTVQEVYDGVMKDVYDFMHDAEQADDITLMILKKSG